MITVPRLTGIKGFSPYFADAPIFDQTALTYADQVYGRGLDLTKMGVGPGYIE